MQIDGKKKINFANRGRSLSCVSVSSLHVHPLLVTYRQLGVVYVLWCVCAIRKISDTTYFQLGTVNLSRDLRFSESTMEVGNNTIF
jgi:hypothetical protein